MLNYFKEITTNTTKFSDCFKSDNPFEEEVEKWLKMHELNINKLSSAKVGSNKLRLKLVTAEVSCDPLREARLLLDI